MENRDNQRRLGAMYLRKSKADAEKERIGRYETLAKHRAELTAMARRMGLAVDRVFEELKSGESIAARDQFRELMDGVAPGSLPRFSGILKKAKSPPQSKIRNFSLSFPLPCKSLHLRVPRPIICQNLL